MSGEHETDPTVDCGPRRFPPEHRVRHRARYQLVQRGGRRVHTPSFLVLVYPRRSDDPFGPGHEHPRLGITITRKVGNAVFRNRFKRVLREVFRLHPEHFPAGTDLVIIAKRGIARLEFSQARDELAAVAPKLARVSRQLRAAQAERADGEHRAKRP